MNPNKKILLTKINALRKEIDELVEIVIALDEDTQSLQPLQYQKTDSDKFLTAKQVCEMLQISDSTFYEHIRTGLLPHGISFGPRSKRWRMSDIEAWREKRQNSDISSQPTTIVMYNAKITGKRRGRPSRVKKLEELRYA